MPASAHDFAAIWRQYQTIKTQEPAKYARDIASEMAISEAELTHSRVGHDAVRLTGDVRDILAALEPVGEIKSICRNDYAVHEQLGEFTHQHISEHAGLVLNPRALDLRLFLGEWASVFHLCEQSRAASARAFSFSTAGRCAAEGLHHGAYRYGGMGRGEHPFSRHLCAAVDDRRRQSDSVCARRRRHRAGSGVAGDDRCPPVFRVTEKYNLSRQQAFRLVGDDLACRVSNDALPTLLETVLQDGNEIMIFVGNRGCVQIFYRRAGEADADERVDQHFQRNLHPCIYATRGSPNAGSPASRPTVVMSPASNSSPTMACR